MAQTTEKKRPPYTSAADLDRLLERMKTLGDPGNITSKWVKDFNLAASQPEGVVSVLRWLGVIDKDGNSLGVWNELRVPATRAETLQRLMNQAYADIFSRVDVNEASREDLVGAFISAYESGSTQRPLGCFLALCQRAGIETKALRRSPQVGRSPQPTQSARASARAKPNSHRSPATPTGAQTQQSTAVLHGPTSIALTLNIDIPGDWTDDQIERRIGSVLHAVGVK